MVELLTIALWALWGIFAVLFRNRDRRVAQAFAYFTALMFLIAFPIFQVLHGSPASEWFGYVQLAVEGALAVLFGVGWALRSLLRSSLFDGVRARMRDRDINEAIRAVEAAEEQRLQRAGAGYRDSAVVVGDRPPPEKTWGPRVRMSLGLLAAFSPIVFLLWWGIGDTIAPAVMMAVVAIAGASVPMVRGVRPARVALARERARVEVESEKMEADLARKLAEEEQALLESSAVGSGRSGQSQ